MIRHMYAVFLDTFVHLYRWGVMLDVVLLPSTMQHSVSDLKSIQCKVVVINQFVVTHETFERTTDGSLRG